MNRKRYYFDAGLAVRHGVNGAVFLHAIAFWVAKNRAGGRHFHQGRTWTYNTLAALTAYFPFWSRRQVERIIAKLKSQGALLTGNFNPNKTDRTVWYTLGDSVLEVYGLPAPETSPNGDDRPPKPGEPVPRLENCIKETVTDQLERPASRAPAGLEAREEVPTW
ncbi:hypothetical protein [uncultured Flavonifractor sp.]|uniref:hypothetical protein n=1 Tax=uncultured Flavonifractor sp. TaxID=1193534 RepID=UPI0026024EAB|nr:hypothetical protein [uncultured Flavonifractor sp.]